MTKFWELLEDHAGGTSSSRVGALFSTVLVLGVWGVITIRMAFTSNLKELPDIPANLGMLIFGLWSMKVVQRFAEKPPEVKA